MNERVTELLAVAQRRQRKSPAKAPVEQAAPSLADDAKRSFDERPKPPAKPDTPTKTPKPRRPTGRKTLPTHLEAENHQIDPKACGECGCSEIDAVDVVVEEKLHVVKEHQRRRVVRRTTCRCRRCGARTTPRSLPAPYERSKVTCDWLARVVHRTRGRPTGTRRRPALATASGRPLDGDGRHGPEGARAEAAQGAQRLHRAVPQPRRRRLPVRARQGRSERRRQAC